MNNLPNFGVNEGVWEYRGADNEFICYVVRYRNSQGKKIFIPFYLEDGKWKKDGFKPEFKPIYRIQYLDKNKPILIVEGEKTADYAVSLFPNYNILSWMGGAQTAGKANWKILQSWNLPIYLLPDNDEPGYKAMNKIKQLLPKSLLVNIESLGITESGWDLADIEGGEIDFEDIKNLISEAKSPLIFPNLTEKGRPLNTSANIKALLNYYGHAVRYNIVSNQVECSIKNASYSKVNEKDCFFAEISELCVLHQVPKIDLDMWLLKIADENSYSPARDFITSRSWDGISRLRQFFDTVNADNQLLAEKLIYRWMLGATAAAFTHNGVSLPGVLIFQGPQGAGKTAWFERLLPDSHRDLLKVSLTIKPKNVDSVVDCTNIWLGELGELDDTFSSSRISSLKAFTSKDSDSYRVAWGKRERRIPRHTAYFATVNPSNFLVDETGNRRWWTVSIKSLIFKREDRIKLDIQQIWAEFKHLLDAGESFNLTHDEIAAMNIENEAFIQMDPMEEAIRNMFRWEEPHRFNRLTPTDVLIAIGYDLTNHHSLSAARKCGGILYKLTGEKSKPSNGKMVFNLPMRK